MPRCRTRERLLEFKASSGVYADPPKPPAPKRPPLLRDWPIEYVVKIALLLVDVRARSRRIFLRGYAGMSHAEAYMLDFKLLEPYVGMKAAAKLAWRYWRRISPREIP